ncbi:uncharacterized protein MONOS_5628 [Monocercomonoides exilis]|uniref:uncharacterized protein n=1 Tax=Monocercomonoides exilis TaxID=2049356 RepID=UPI003559564D|nr:hypothetical protein MONOS_5628 [Monocercomonoides exilis]|eukprot:MONOS_5628.1-p1 / transcript=MONOS_5628.1 / gene=MONOS_5628 / organism=Monocercomonoides_exilis_PA203 / gene_product=DNA mismatch repair protein MutT / transcript_product=DNA mismatch repair protein MutT / location=Mono_scaffold00166:37091-38737(-) / protein_length=548 / sequence_SO=supercontig / SO=protein_coding / is_pseudo=false
MLCDLINERDAVLLFGGRNISIDTSGSFSVVVDKTPPEAGFYPPGTTVNEINEFISAHPEKKKLMMRVDTIVRKDTENNFIAQTIRDTWPELAKRLYFHVDLAGRLISNEDPELGNYLIKRASALFKGKPLKQTDEMWVELGEKHDLDVVIGPIETYEDKLFGAKGSWMCAVMLRAPKEETKTKSLVRMVQAVEATLPMKKKWMWRTKSSEEKEGERTAERKNPVEMHLEVVDMIYAGGRVRTPSVGMAHNLPNDPVVKEKKGSRNHLFANIIKEKMKVIIRPIGMKILHSSQQHLLSETGMMDHVMLHELSHSLGPVYSDISKPIPSFALPSLSSKQLTLQSQVPVREALTDCFSSIEECKADVVGQLFGWRVADGIVQDLDAEKVPVIDRDEAMEMSATHLASLFRSIRFGLKSAHAKGSLIQLNWLMENGAISLRVDGNEEEDENGNDAFIKSIRKNSNRFNRRKMRNGSSTSFDNLRLFIDFNRWKASLNDLASILLHIEGEGDKEAAKQLIDKYGSRLPDWVEFYLVQVDDVAIDLNIHFNLD